MKDLRTVETDKKKKRNLIKLKFLLFLQKRKWWILLIILLTTIIIYPEASGSAIGQWVHDFVGSLVTKSQF